VTYYEVLGVRPDARPDEVRDAYRELARRHHPDLGGDPAHMQAVNEAWKVLGDAAARRAYDHDLVSCSDDPSETADEDPFTGWTADRPQATDEGPGVELPRRLRSFVLIAPGVFVVAIVAGTLGLLLDMRALAAAAVVLGGLSLLLFFLAPLMTMAYESRHSDGGS
jgi:preprotein translocase subunit Sec63